MRDTLTPAALQSDHDDAVDADDAAHVQRQLELLVELPNGLRIDRTRADRVPAGRDPGLELTVVDDRYRPPRLVASVARRLIGKQAVTWTPGQLCDPQSTAAFVVAVRFALLDAERFAVQPPAAPAAARA